MNWKRRLLETIVWSIAQATPRLTTVPAQPESILVLRNNDLGDVLVITPLFAALRQRFPNAQIVAAVGKWSKDILQGNPHIDRVMPVTAPWYNKFTADQSLAAIWRYLFTDHELKQIKQQNFTIGIDIFGSQFGSLFMLRAGIPYRLGVKGFAGGHTATQQSVNYNPWEQVGRSALRFAELLGASEIPEARPQLFLTSSEQQAGQQIWADLEAKFNQGGDRNDPLPSSASDQVSQSKIKRIVISPGAGFVEKAWPLNHYVELVKILSASNQTQEQAQALQILIVGGKGDRIAGDQIAAVADQVVNLAGDLALRETFALVSHSDLVVCNSSMLMHVAAAFSIANVVLLGDFFPSAKQHAAQWGYAKTCWVYGKETDDRNDIYNPVEVAAIVTGLLEVC
ncbi:glycosyl transferase family 9 [Thalassoporum mexicanum PCC 7367]|uniref:glycosyltransferase family 9 protein n=1 Tax=Thalassoporum mexicanum TaxID=3457544 RepID=UPI00029F9F22|nr:glycosyltransferase family 9 protein [Pseudanabaena sp. PCC 7367]AFY71122.1 glycosyl transferase family 9 [Pseudanabaena sp. PCC 7367]